MTDESTRMPGQCEACFQRGRCDGICAEMLRATDEMLAVFAPDGEAPSTAPSPDVLVGGETA